MAQLRHLIDNEKDIWHLKDELELLRQNPIHMHKQKFIDYMEAKAKELYARYVEEGDPHELAVKKAQMSLNEDAKAWKREARRRHR